MGFFPVQDHSGARQLVATLGPASLAEAPALASAGATAFRLNASHLETRELSAALDALRRSVPDAPLLVDLQGAKMRLGRFEPQAVRSGDLVLFARAASGGRGVPLPHPELFRAAQTGQTLSSDDDRLRFRVVGVQADSLEALALTDGILRPRKSINLVEHPVLLDDLTEVDCEVCEVLARHPGVACAFSFMKDGTEAEWLRRRVPGCPVIGKIERREAIDNLAVIAERVDSIWICRGDLGAQLGPAGMARAVAAIDPRALRKPVLMAGQVLEHLTHHPEPTRSEVCHLHDLLARGYAGIVLSDETAIGALPIRATAEAAALLRELG